MKRIKRIVAKILTKSEPRYTKGAELVGIPGAFEQKRQFQISFLKNQGLAPGDIFIDIGCGVLRGGMPVVEFLDVGKYIGIDVNDEALKVARENVNRENLQHKLPQLIHSDGTLDKIDITKKGDVIWAFSVLIHMTDELVVNCLEFVKKNLAKEGLFYANVNIGSESDGEWKEYPVKWRSLDWYSERVRLAGLKLENIGTLASFGHHSITDKREDEQVMLKISHLA